MKRYNTSVTLENNLYPIQVYKKSELDLDVPRIAIPSYLPTKETVEILKIAIESIFKYTDSTFELWICDNNSPIENIQWLYDFPSINLIINRNDYGFGGSYQNAVALELVRSQLPNETRYLMSLHQDIAVIKKGWLTFLKSKLKDNVVAAGVREDKGRVKDGILHVLGYLVDLSKVSENNLNYFPDLPDYDIGDKIIHELKNKGFSYWAAKNTLWSPELVDKISKNSDLKELSVDRSFDDEGDIFFLHLGRGVEKTKSDQKNLKVEQWISTIRKNYLNKYEKDVNINYLRDINYSIRRYFTDSFLNKACLRIASSIEIIDIGGKKSSKRGYFNIEDYFNKVTYLNIDESTKPDILGSLYSIPVDNGRFDAFILTEVLEHLSEPINALIEANRVIKKGGYGIITTPFMFHIHGDPDDYFRPTIQWFVENLTKSGFDIISIQPHGGFWAVLVNELRFFLRYLMAIKSPALMSKILRSYLGATINWLIKKNYISKIYNNSILDGHTTGYGIIVRKK
jgi:SAM-dependent methyltransferase